MLVAPHGLAQAVNQFRRPVASVAESAREPLTAKQVVRRALGIGDPIGVKQKSVASFKLHGGFLESL